MSHKLEADIEREYDTDLLLVKEKTRGGKGRKVKRKGREGREEVSLSEGDERKQSKTASRKKLTLDPNP